MKTGKFWMYAGVTIVVVFLVLGFGGKFSGVRAAGPPAVNLGTAGNFAILSKAAITNIPTSVINGNVGASPISGSSIGLTCAEVSGTIYSTDGAGPLPCRVTDAPLLTTAVSDMEAAYTDAAGRIPPTATEVDAGLLGAITPPFVPGIYKWSTDVTISQDITLTGGANDVWIFQIAGDLTVASAGSLVSGVHILLAGGARASNVFWQVAGPINGATLGTYSTFNGTILSLSQIVMQTGAVLNGKALAQTQVTLDQNTISVPILRVVKLVVNGSGGTATPSTFNVHVKNASSGVDVSGSPTVGTAAPGTTYALDDGTYLVSEDANASYVRTFSGDCDATGNVTLSGGLSKICTIINTDIPPPAAVAPVAVSGISARIVPLIGILKVPTPLALPEGSGSVVYNYTVWNVGGQEALTDVSVADDKCTPLTLLSGDVNSNTKLDPGETWTYSCTMTLSETTTNTSVATGHSDDGANQATIATAIATVVVGASTPPPLINILKIPSRLTPLPFGGGDVTYTYTVTNPGVVAMHDVVVTDDDRCGKVSRTSGDINGDNLLDPGEIWIYTCQINVPVSTRNVVTAEGRANGFTALGYAFSTVLVSGPGLPNTGLYSEVNSTPWNTVLLAGIFAISLTLCIIRKKQII